MAKYTNEQVQKWSAKLQNGFKMDLQQLLFWNEKTAVKSITLGAGKYLHAELSWYEVRNGRWGKVLGVCPKLRLSIWNDTSTPGLISSCGLGAIVELTEEIFPRKNWNHLVKLTADWTEEKILEEGRKHIAELNEARIL